MGKTIEERLDALYCEDYVNLMNPPTPVQIIQATITDPWNAALKAMQSVVDGNVSFTEYGTWYCLHCERYNHQGHIDYCYVGKCHTAIAQMEGN